ncbi:enoyl-ACP reductase [Candidatus Sumerlaeota bacterium]|nr:enoyl-ACP reductase [Candidatus Sumerlaeota bacterium]
MGSLDGKQGIILGIANQNSIAWAVAQSMRAAGARLAFNFLNERMEPKVKKLTDTISDSITLPCDVTKDEEIESFFTSVGEFFGGKLDFLVHSIAFANREDLEGRFVNTSRSGWATALEISAYSLVAVSRRALPLLETAGGGSIMTMSYYGAEKAVPNYNVMGVAKAALEASVRYLAADLGPQRIRVNAISAGPVNTLSARGIKGFTGMLHAAAERSPLHRSITPTEVGETAVFLASDGAAAITGETLHVDAGYNIMGT